VTDWTSALSTRYFKMTTLQLRTLRSQKMNRIASLERKQLGYFDQIEIRKLRGHLRLINAVLASRDSQPELL